MYKVSFHNKDVSYRLSDKKRLRQWIGDAIIRENCSPGEIDIIFCTDKYLLELNKEYLQHDYFTDIITFDYSTENMISGDLFISLDRVKDNAIKLKVTFVEEIQRVIIHGVMHLCGYKDKTSIAKTIMTKKEDFYLQLLIQKD
jgi:probable rRNA maturation factor